MPLWYSCPDCKLTTFSLSLQMHFLHVIYSLGYNVLLQDSDVIWIQSPLDYLHELRWSAKPAMIAWHTKYDDLAFTPLNTGFVFM